MGDENSASDYQQYSGPFDLSKGGRVSAYCMDPATGNRSDIVSKRFDVAKSKWKVIGCSYPNEQDASINRLIDGDYSTMWHTHGKEGRQPPPQWVTIDLGETIRVAGFSYIPRHDGCLVGLVDRYEFHVSKDGMDWGRPAAQGEFSNIQNNPIEQVVRIPSAQDIRFIKFAATHALEANDCVAVCELGIVGVDVHQSGSYLAQSPGKEPIDKFSTLENSMGKKNLLRNDCKPNSLRR